MKTPHFNYSIRISQQFSETRDEPESKRRKTHETDPTLPDWSKLPSELWLVIFDYLKPKDKCMKRLTETCKLFNKLCVPRLALRINSSKIPVDHFVRRYTSVTSARGFKDNNEIQRVFQSSRESLKSVGIGKFDGSSTLKISATALQLLFEYLPSIEDINIERVELLQAKRVDSHRQLYLNLKNSDCATWMVSAT